MHWENPSAFHRMTYQLDLGIIAYGPVWHLQRKIVAAKMGQLLSDMLTVVEHEPVYTVGRGKPGASKSFDGDSIRSKGARQSNRQSILRGVVNI